MREFSQYFGHKYFFQCIVLSATPLLTRGQWVFEGSIVKICALDILPDAAHKECVSPPRTEHDHLLLW